MKKHHKRPVYIDEIKEECLKEGVKERERLQRRWEYILSAFVIVDWGIVCAIALLAKMFALVPALVCGWVGVAFFVVYIFSHE